MNNFRVVASVVYECLRRKDPILPEIDKNPIYTPKVLVKMSSSESKEGENNQENNNENNDKSGSNEEKDNKNNNNNNDNNNNNNNAEEEGSVAIDVKPDARRGGMNDQATEAGSQMGEERGSQVGEDAKEEMSAFEAWIENFLGNFSCFRKEDDEDKIDNAKERKKRLQAMIRTRDPLESFGNLEYYLRNFDDFRESESAMLGWMDELADYIDEWTVGVTTQVIQKQKQKAQEMALA